jgi:hypothetical protein
VGFAEENCFVDGMPGQGLDRDLAGDIGIFRQVHNSL